MAFGVDSIRKATLRLCFSVLAGMSSFASIAGTIDSGENAYERCALCHGLYGVTPRSKFPILAGQNPDYMESQIRAFLTGARTNDGGQMQGVVTEITDEQIVEVVAWFTSQELPVASNGSNKDGEAFFNNNGCAACHLEKRATNELVPLLFAQHKDYLAKQMRELRDGERQTDYEKTLHQKLSTLSDTDLGAIAEYLASQGHRQ